MNLQEALEWADGYVAKDKERKAEVGTLAAAVRELEAECAHHQQETNTVADALGHLGLEMDEMIKQRDRWTTAYYSMLEEKRATEKERDFLRSEMQILFATERDDLASDYRAAIKERDELRMWKEMTICQSPYEAAVATLRIERDELRAENAALRRVVDAAREHFTTANEPERSYRYADLCAALRALDAGKGE